MAAVSASWTRIARKVRIRPDCDECLAVLTTARALDSRHATHDGVDLNSVIIDDRATGLMHVALRNGIGEDRQRKPVTP